DHDLFIKAGQGFQSKGGHHAVGYWTKTKLPEQVKVCTEDDMINFHFLSGGGGETGNGIVNGLPAGTAFKIPAGAQLVINAHVINASSKTIDAQSAINLYYADDKAQPLTDFYISGTDFE